MFLRFSWPYTVRVSSSRPGLCAFCKSEKGSFQNRKVQNFVASAVLQVKHDGIYVVVLRPQVQSLDVTAEESKGDGGGKDEGEK